MLGSGPGQDRPAPSRGPDGFRAGDRQADLLRTLIASNARPAGRARRPPAPPGPAAPDRVLPGWRLQLAKHGGVHVHGVRGAVSGRTAGDRHLQRPPQHLAQPPSRPARRQTPQLIVPADRLTRTPATPRCRQDQAQALRWALVRRPRVRPDARTSQTAGRAGLPAPASAVAAPTRRKPAAHPHATHLSAIRPPRALSPPTTPLNDSHAPPNSSVTDRPLKAFEPDHRPGHGRTAD